MGNPGALVKFHRLGVPVCRGGGFKPASIFGCVSSGLSQAEMDMVVKRDIKSLARDREIGSNRVVA